MSEDGFWVARVNEARCVDCGFCQSTLYCPSPEACIGCGVCVQGCPYQAREMVPDEAPRANIQVTVDGQPLTVPERITVKRALELAGFSFGASWGEGDVPGLPAPAGETGCDTGGCYTCAVLVTDGLRREPPAPHPRRGAGGTGRRTAVRACVSPVRDGMVIETALPAHHVPQRIIHAPQGHAVGGKGTPWWLKTERRFIEVAIWTAGCNLRCPQCQNFATTYDGTSQPMTPQEAARLVTRARQRHRVDRMAVSGGEATLNRPWLVAYFRALKALNPDPAARLHLDTNGTLLTPDYIDELVLEAGVTDIGIEPKAVRVSTFQRITGITNADLARRYLETAWCAVEYVVATHLDRVFLGVGMPYNQELVRLHEVETFGQRLAGIDPNVQLCVLDYFPTFRRRRLRRPNPSEMLDVKRILEGTGLRTVVVQTAIGHFGPESRN